MHDRSAAYRDIEVRTSAVCLRADPDDARVLDSADRTTRAALIGERIERWAEFADF